MTDLDVDMQRADAGHRQISPASPGERRRRLALTAFITFAAALAALALIFL